ncbi:4-oxalocrotonate tautomerase [endosymbiont of Acanthamoeba sp. UWC8]|uniref:2-hydroxymuconate tautomerase n=1 Tax=endosymbiont of Acanthamoeba sp. UWC8 TaxID=86106 RepID=UPI0004D15A9D|nr:2-hydroxymuconate tautomerase [endosymbiont of Acanthamoeba sp. UWC8]AIF80800.1 4-oxalocrotonate tautomerase [endosymbiont of Acanthamoeba sp. UWC8]
MPVLVVNMMEGRTDDQKRLLVEKVTDAVCVALGSEPNRVRIIINEMPGNGYAIGGKLMQDTDEKYKKR